MSKIAVCTTFPRGFPTAEAMLTSFDKHWPKDIAMFIDLDDMPDSEASAAVQEFSKLFPSGRELYITTKWTPERKKFLAENKDAGKDYRFHVARFSHKVFALWNVVQQLDDSYDYLIWLDADVITTKDIDDMACFVPVFDTVSYLGRTEAPHSECGFVAYNLRRGGKEFIGSMASYYLTGKVLTLPGWTDCDVFDDVLKSYSGINLAANVAKDLSKGSDGWNVWPFTVLGEYMTHYKGARKYGKDKVKQEEQRIELKDISNKTKVTNGAIMADNLQVKTKNCLPNEQICANVAANMKLIKHWATYCKPHDEELVICSAGESLSYHDVKPWADKGAKIVTVKHAIDRLKQWGIKPWACVLLDPRQHVEGFVSKPDKDVIYFVASMVDPSVVKALLDNDCTVIGYHAFVGAGEQEIIAKEHPKALMVSGGSATATRSIGLFAECLGFKTFHLYGYDLCYFDRPDFSKKHDDGSPKYMEVTLGTTGWGNRQKKRVFWTEGQFLAQAQELRDLYKMEKDFKLNVYGPGIAAWFYQNHQDGKAWSDKHNRDLDERKLHGFPVNEWLDAVRRN